MSKIPEIPLDILYEPAPVTCGPFEIGVGETAKASPKGEFFLNIGNIETGRSVARITAMATLDAEDMGIAYLLAASFDLMKVAEEYVELLQSIAARLRRDNPTAKADRAFIDEKLRVAVDALKKAKGEAE